MTKDDRISKFLDRIPMWFVILIFWLCAFLAYYMYTQGVIKYCAELGC